MTPLESPSESGSLLLEAVVVAELHQSDCPALLREQLQTPAFVWQCVLSPRAAAPFD